MKIVCDTTEVADKIRELYRITAELEEMFPGSKFTLDGHMLGSIGEVLAADKYGLTLLDNSFETHDGKTGDGRFVQIKTTQTKRIALSSEPDYLLVIKIHSSGEWEEIYNGPGKLPWENAGKLQKNGQRAISLQKLWKLMEAVANEQKINAVK